jgi:hypothetical protein
MALLLLLLLFSTIIQGGNRDPDLAGHLDSLGMHQACLAHRVTINLIHKCDFATRLQKIKTVWIFYVLGFVTSDGAALLELLLLCSIIKYSKYLYLTEYHLQLLWDDLFFDDRSQQG